jgi:hypothetical protein
MAELTLVEAVNDALRTEMERDETVMVMGEDVGRAGGVFRATAGLRDRFGPDRCVDTPLAEAGIMGTAVGLAMAGWKPVCEMQYESFSYPSLDQLIRAARGLAGGLLRAHAGDQGRDPLDSSGREGSPRGGHPLTRSGRPHGAEGALSKPA